MEESLISFFVSQKQVKLEWTKKYLMRRFTISQHFLDGMLARLKAMGYIDYTTKRNCPTVFTLLPKAAALKKEIEHATIAQSTPTDKSDDNNNNHVLPRIAPQKGDKVETSTQTVRCCKDDTANAILSAGLKELEDIGWA